jgi:hypothetical protein
VGGIVSHLAANGGEVINSSKRKKTIIGSMCVIIGIIIISCQAVKVSLSNYNPVLTDDYSVYKGKCVYLMNFDNQANDTSIWYYYSLDKKFSYSINDTIHNYFWYAFQNAFIKAGMGVFNVDNPDLTAPAMWLTLLSITDASYHVRVTVQKGEVTVFAEKYTLREPLIGEKDRNIAALEQRAYRMTNRLIETIMKDPSFRKVLTEP